MQGMETVVKKVKPGRKLGHKMPDWSKQLIMSRRDCINLESSNRMLVKLGEALSELDKNDVFILANTATGRKKSLSLLGFISGKPANIRLFMFLDSATKTRTSFKTQEIYDGLVSGVFKPENPKTREKLYRTLLSSPEITESIRSRAVAARERLRTEENEFGDEDIVSMPSHDGIDEELAELVRMAGSMTEQFEDAQ